MSNFFDSVFSNIAFKALAKAILIISKEDKFMQLLVSKLDNKETIFKIVQFDTTASINIKKCVDSNILFSSKNVNEAADITIISKSMDVTYSLVKGTRSIADCYNQQGFVVIGDVRKSIAIVNILAYAFACIFSRKKYIDCYVDEPKFSVSKSKLIFKILF